MLPPQDRLLKTGALASRCPNMVKLSEGTREVGAHAMLGLLPAVYNQYLFLSPGHIWLISSIGYIT